MAMSSTTTHMSKTYCERSRGMTCVNTMLLAKYAATNSAALTGFLARGRLNTTRYEVAMINTHRSNSTAWRLLSGDSARALTAAILDTLSMGVAESVPRADSWRAAT